MHGRAMPYLCDLYGRAGGAPVYKTVPHQTCVTLHKMHVCMHIFMHISNAAGSLEQVHACFELPEAEAEAGAQANTGSLCHKTKELPGKNEQFLMVEMSNDQGKTAYKSICMPSMGMQLRGNRRGVEGIKAQPEGRQVTA